MLSSVFDDPETIKKTKSRQHSAYVNKQLAHLLRLFDIHGEKDRNYGHGLNSTPYKVKGDGVQGSSNMSNGISFPNTKSSEEKLGNVVDYVKVVDQMGVNTGNSFSGILNSERFNLMQNMSYVCSLAMDKTKDNENSNGKNLIASIYINFDNFKHSMYTMTENLKCFPASERFMIIYDVSNYNSLDRMNSKNIYTAVNSMGEYITVVAFQMNYRQFIDNIESILDNKRIYLQNKDLPDKDVNNNYDEELIISPIIHFRDLHWSNILFLFKNNGYNLYGGSGTKRHKLSLVEYKLARFIDMTGCVKNTNSLYESYSDNFLSTNTMDRDFFNFK